jgi:hypothetical protein
LTVTSPPRGWGRRRWLNDLAGTAAVAILAVGAAACVPARAVPTPIYVVITFPPTPSAAASAPDSPAARPTVTPSPSPTEAPTPVVVGGPSASPSPSPMPTPTPTAAPASACSGTAANKAFWGQAAGALSWPIYCPILPSGWVVKSGSYEGSPPGYLNVALEGPGGATLELDEGAFCTAGAASCAPHTAEIAAASFGGLAGTLDTTSAGFAIYVDPGTTLAYGITGTGVSRDEFVAIAAAMVRVAKP